MTRALGIDIGGTKMLSAIIDENGNVLSDIKKHSTPKDAGEIVNLLKKIIDESVADIL